MPVDYVSMNPKFQASAHPEATRTKVARPYDDMEIATPLTINTLFRSQSQIPLPIKPASYAYDYGQAPSRPNVSSLFGAIPHMGTPLEQTGKGGFKPLEPPNLWPNLKMSC